ncbi:MAG TPA: glycosyltransferase [Desulfuromonadales bacterium]|nr:glycosyltransferase [Desulfuromonadales bacterium]
MGRLNYRLHNLYRKVSRLFGAPEISQRRIQAFLNSVSSVGQLRSENPPVSVAVVIPCYGHSAFLAQALESIANQSRLPDEVIAIDDCSPDHSGAVLAEGFARLGARGNIRCTLLNNDSNRGQAFSLNRGVAAAASELIIILNDDDYLMHDAVATLLELFKLRTDVVMIGGTSVHFCSNEELASHSKSSRSTPGGPVALSVSLPADVSSFRRYNDLNMTHSGSCFLKSAWETVGGYYADKSKRLVPFSDRDFQLRVNALFPVAVSNDVPFSLWRRGSSVDQGRDS